VIALFTDFSLADPYIGQMHVVLGREAPGATVVDLFHAVPSYDIRAAAYLLPAYADPELLPARGVFICVVDPGVGGTRRPVLIEIGGRYYVGPDNGLFRVLARRHRPQASREIHWQPARLSRSFHGRDLFAPVAAMLWRGEMPSSQTAKIETVVDEGWPDEMWRVLYLDHFGNAVTGVRADHLAPGTVLRIGPHSFLPAGCFSDVPVGRSCWYRNANGLVEIAVNRGSAVDCYGIRLNDPVCVLEGSGQTDKLSHVGSQAP